MYWEQSAALGYQSAIDKLLGLYGMTYPAGDDCGGMSADFSSGSAGFPP